jgi:hypothetical protein
VCTKHAGQVHACLIIHAYGANTLQIYRNALA